MTKLTNAARGAMDTTITALLAGGKGILAADEGPPVMSMRLKEAGIAEAPDTAVRYREMLFGTDGVFGAAISGVIVEEGTLGHIGSSGKPLTAVFEGAGAIAGIKVDRGLNPDPSFPQETITAGIDGLAERLDVFKTQGARFAKWRAAFKITDVLPSQANVVYNLSVMAKYAAACQNAGIVPIVEPEILTTGSHGIARCAEVTEQVLRTLYECLHEHGVSLEHTILKPNMVTPGTASGEAVTEDDIAAATIAVLKRTVPAAVPGIAFLSGGQSEAEATARLNAMCRLGRLPWVVTFSYGRGLQDGARKAWGGDANNSAVARAVFAHRAEMNRLATLGDWSYDSEAAMGPAD